MKMFLLSQDEDTVTGFRLAGVEGAVVKSEQEFTFRASSAIEDETVAIVLITSALAEKYPERVLEMRKGTKKLITEIPVMNGSAQAGNSVARYVKDTVGMTV